MDKKEAQSKIIVALDVDTYDEAISLVKATAPFVGGFKVGLELYLSCGNKIIEDINKDNFTFLDLKFHDIGTTVAKAAIAATRLGVNMFNIHATNGFDTMRNVAEAVQETSVKYGLVKPKVLAVTVLTSISQEVLTKFLHVDTTLEEYVRWLAYNARVTGLDGVVCSPLEIERIRNTCGEDFCVVTPGVRPFWADANDQKRFTTPKQALDLGANYLVVGRPITQAKSPALAAETLLQELL